MTLALLLHRNIGRRRLRKKRITTPDAHETLQVLDLLPKRALNSRDP
jgi:hypothetical protein